MNHGNLPSTKTMLPEKEFLHIVEHTPLVSIDLIIRNAAGAVLLGKRLNCPAKGTWFVPGGSIKKDERLAQAMARISQRELGFVIDIGDTTQLGAYEHLYPDNFAEAPGISTHYVVVAYSYQLPEGQEIQGDDQHDTLEWWDVETLLADPEVHDNTKAYFQA